MPEKGQRVSFRSPSAWCHPAYSLTAAVGDDDEVELNVLGGRVDILGTNCDQCECMVEGRFTSTETVRLIRTGDPRRPPRRPHSS